MAINEYVPFAYSNVYTKLPSAMASFRLHCGRRTATAGQLEGVVLLTYMHGFDDGDHAMILPTGPRSPLCRCAALHSYRRTSAPKTRSVTTPRLPFASRSLTSLFFALPAGCSLTSTISPVLIPMTQPISLNLHNIATRKELKLWPEDFFPN